MSSAETETVFFTGGAGFIGLHVVPMLLLSLIHISEPTRPY